MFAAKCRDPLNPGNRKVIVFTAFADTALHLYDELAPWALETLGLHAALVTGTGQNRTTLPELRRDLGSILTAFSPRSKERSEEFAGEGELDLLIATDCISEGQNLQDCDYLMNYDIHWNPARVIQRFGRIDRIGSPNERRGAVREYLKIAVLTVAPRPAAKPTRLVELIHRTIPYPVVLVAEHGDTVGLSLAHKRWFQGEAGKTVLDGDVVAVEWNHERHETHEELARVRKRL